MSTTRLIAIVSLVLPLFAQAWVPIPDPHFSMYLENVVGTAISGGLLDETDPSVLGLTEIDLSDLDAWDYPITNLTAIEHFTSLENLTLGSHPIATFPSLPASITSLNAQDSPLTTLPDLPPGLLSLVCSYSSIATLPPLPASLQGLFATQTALTSLPQLPSSLLTLSCGFNAGLTGLPVLPVGLNLLSCGYCSITTLPELPDGIVNLTCNDNLLSELPELPASLTFFNCDGNQLTTLPVLPQYLQNMYCGNNPITQLPVFPSNFRVLRCENTLLTWLPAFPPLFNQLYMSGSPISELPALPPLFDVLDCSNTPIVSIPSLPGTFYHLDCSACSNLVCIPTLPTGMLFLFAQGSGISCLPNIPAGLITMEVDFDALVCDPATSPCPLDQSVATGTVFRDVDGDAVFDPGETVITNMQVQTYPAGNACSVGVNGFYALPLAIGTWDFDGSELLYHSQTTPAQSATFTGDGEIDQQNDIGYLPIPGIHDLVVNLTSGAAVPGFDNQVWLLVTNVGTEPTSGGILFQFDPHQSFVESTLSPTSLLGEQVYWDLSNMAPGAVWQNVVTMHTGADVDLGTQLDELFSATPSVPDTTSANNSQMLSRPVVGSYDPNDKQVQPSSLTPGAVSAGARVSYTIRFQNTGDFPAERVRISDVLDEYLDPASFEFVASSHPCSWTIDGDLLVFLFEPIALPDSASDPLGSQGFVTFSIRVSTLVQEGDSILNAANIFFDFNPPVITEPSVLTAEFSTGVGELATNELRVFPNPVADEVRIANAGAPIRCIRLLAADGREVSALRSVGSAAAVHVGALAAGAYFIQAELMDGRVIHGRFNKQ